MTEDYYQVEMEGISEDASFDTYIFFAAGYIKAKISIARLLDALRYPNVLEELKKEIKAFYDRFWDNGEEAWDTTLGDTPKETYINAFFVEEGFLRMHQQ